MPAFQCGCLRADKIVTKENDSMVKDKDQGYWTQRSWRQFCPYPDATPFSKGNFWCVHLIQLVSLVRFEGVEEDDACVKEREREVQRV